MKPKKKSPNDPKTAAGDGRYSSLYRSSREIRGVRAALRGTRASVELSGQRDWPYLPGAIIENGDRFFCRCEQSLTVDPGKVSFLSYT